jgi:hypothetical protein
MLINKLYYRYITIISISMSWFKRSPRKNEPAKPHAAPHHTSPAAERMMEKAKATSPKKKEKVKN